ncbi:CENPH protein, partial [Cisticola juncidis]|nr:CENPH protein [Cisticola juncidis]
PNEGTAHGVQQRHSYHAVKDLQTTIEEAKVSFQNKTLALQRVQIMDALRKKLEQDDEDSRLILETLNRIGLLSRTIIECQRQACEKEQKMTDIKRKRFSLKAEGQKLHQMQTTMKRQKEKQESMNVTEKENRLNKLEQERQMTTIIQNVFQSIIIGSRINWAEDPSLKKIVLQLEKNVYFQ